MQTCCDARTRTHTVSDRTAAGQERGPRAGHGGRACLPARFPRVHSFVPDLRGALAPPASWGPEGGREGARERWRASWRDRLGQERSGRAEGRVGRGRRGRSRALRGADVLRNIEVQHLASDGPSRPQRPWPPSSSVGPAAPTFRRTRAGGPAPSWEGLNFLEAVAELQFRCAPPAAGCWGAGGGAGGGARAGPEAERVRGRDQLTPKGSEARRARARTQRGCWAPRSPGLEGSGCPRCEGFAPP